MAAPACDPSVVGWGILGRKVCRLWSIMSSRPDWTRVRACLKGGGGGGRKMRRKKKRNDKEEGKEEGGRRCRED